MRGTASKELMYTFTVNLSPVVREGGGGGGGGVHPPSGQLFFKISRTARNFLMKLW